MVGALPFLIKKGALGEVANALPFFGSNPGIIIDPKLDNELKKEIKKGLVTVFWRVTESFFSACLIEKPFDPDFDLYNVRYNGRIEQGEGIFTDKRIGMMTRIPEKGEVINIYHSKTRNLVKKAIKEGLIVERTRDINDLEQIIEIHKKNMMAIGAPYKPMSFFAWLKRKIGDLDTMIYKAVHPKDGSIIAGLVLFVHNQTAEYFMPVIKEEARIMAPLNLIIYKAMSDLQKRKVGLWNWGGTATEGQEGVAHFKRRFGAEEVLYYYHIRTKAKNLVMTPQELSKEYKYFYVLPYNQLISKMNSPTDFYWQPDEEGK
ncbi:MAG: peptidoglycan bridge formation glycyltransferase FemA/FemB family protein [Candidatus Colwellbacteria bacterium]|nr:peptidoglycan bridge formation glycyltransferase FemA/FemB family protein [Candidatus Colwellbacteria bacterium]